MAMWWLDLVRYADSVGYHGDQAVSVFPFREYVIRAFNDNKRFDRSQSNSWPATCSLTLRSKTRLPLATTAWG